jgi:hypothetical protein
MSDLSLDLREQIARIDRARAESDKFVAEQRKLIAEALKFDKERWWFPWLQLLTVCVSSAAVAAVVARLI